MIHKSLSPHQSRAVILWIDHCTWDCNWWRLDRAEPSQPSNKEALGRRLRDDFNNVKPRRRTWAANEHGGLWVLALSDTGPDKHLATGTRKHPLPSTPETKHCQLRALMLRQHGSQNRFCQLHRCPPMPLCNLYLCPFQLFMWNFMWMCKLGKCLCRTCCGFLLSFSHSWNRKGLHVNLYFKENQGVDKNHVFYTSRTVYDKVCSVA